MTTDDDRLLEAHFDAARRAPGPGADLVARVLADAAAVQAAPVAPAPAAPHRRGAVRSVLEALGGWIAVSGLAAACAAGVAIGAALPETIDSATGGTVSAVFGTASAAGFASFEAIGLAEGIEGLE